MRIGIFTDSYRPYVSGVVRSIETSATELRKRGHEVYIFAPHYPGCQEQEDHVFRFPSFRSPTHPDFYIGVPVPWFAEKLLKKVELDIIHVHSPFLLGRLGAFFAKKLKKPLVFTYHTLYDQYVHYVPFAQGLARRLTIRLAREFCNRCDLVITPTSVVKKLLKSYGVRSPVAVIPTGINLEQFRDGEPSFLRKKFSIPQGEKVLLFVGRLGKEKNLSSLFRTFRQVLDYFPNTTLVLVGRGPEKEALEQLASELGIRPKVIFTGLLPPEDVVNAYRSADVFVFPSLTETQGLVVAEAMAAGLPVVARAAFGTLAMVKNGVTGYLCQDEGEFTEKLISLLKNPQKIKEMGEQAREQVEEISLERMVQRLEDVYLALAQRKSESLSHLVNEDVC